ncbi:YoaK family protein [Williamsia sp. CHRR-6]|uniref:YoaK family protein n=1 Tax=Williamsia sp. CHRR-6 TaxID=2835871 RepID=UPI001BD97170|nr:YoaK family protein [Williamsia sp. CHRR-6]MBT0567351.1 DUF1275 domain-containing protein [Williamsia sp. CHRR-6]
MSPTARPVTIVFAGLLGAVSGSVDVLVFTRLGGVFASVITGNVVVVGAAIGSGRFGVMSHAAVAVLGYALGVLAATVATRHVDDHPARGAATLVVAVYATEWALVTGVGAVWLGAHGRPGGWVQYLALIGVATAMGMQSRAFAMDRLPGVTTTYFTGTLTGLLTGLITHSTINRAAAAALVSLLLGAAASGAVISVARTFAPLVPISLLSVAVAMAVLRWRRHPAT